MGIIEEISRLVDMKKSFTVVDISDSLYLVERKLLSLNIINFVGEEHSYKITNRTTYGSRVLFYNKKDFLLFKLKYNNVIYSSASYK